MLASGIHTGGLQDVRNSLKEGKRIGSRREKQLFPPPQPLKQPLQARINEALSPNQPNRIFRTRVASPGETFGGSNGIGLTARERASTWRDQSWSLSRRQHCKKTASSILRGGCSCVGPARSWGRRGGYSSSEQDKYCLFPAFAQSSVLLICSVLLPLNSFLSVSMRVRTNNNPPHLHHTGVFLPRLTHWQTSFENYA